MFTLLMNLATNYLDMIKKLESEKNRNSKGIQQINDEFYIVCMLNALFGNPNIHLI